MLNSMRTVQNSWVGKVGMALIFVLIIVGLSFFGFADLFRTSTAHWAARVGNHDISVDAYQRGYQIALQQLQQRLRRPVTNQQARQFGLEQQVLSRLITDAILDNEADALGLAISDAQVGSAVVSDPTFAGANGQFDRDRFNQLLRNNNLTEQAFVRDQRQTYVRQELVEGVAGAVAVPKLALDALHRLQAETRSIDMVVLQPAMAGEVPAPDEAALRKFYEDHQGSFAAPEYRKLTVLGTSPATVAKPDAVSDEDIRKLYDADPDSSFGQPERRAVQQATYPNEADAEAAADAVKSGKSFAEVAAGKLQDLGTIAKGAIFDKAVADAAFALPADGTSAPIKGTFGTVLVHVGTIEPGTKKPLDEVAGQIRTAIATSPARTRDALRAIHDKVEDARAAGKPLTEAAQAAGVTVRQIDAVDATGHDPSGQLVDIPDRDEVLHAAFASDIGVDNDVIQTRAGDQIWFEVAGITPAHQRKFEDVKAQVETAWRQDETAKQLATKADDLVKALNGGQTPEQVAAGLGGTAVKHNGDVKRTGAEGISPAVVAKVFDVPVNGAGEVEGPDNTRIVFKVLDSVVPPLDPDDPKTTQIESQYRNLFADDLVAAYLSRLQGTMNIKVNPTVLNSVSGGES
jgi:peptidyl-prolyl cis-trans isomerase D